MNNPTQALQEQARRRALDLEELARALQEMAAHLRHPQLDARAASLAAKALSFNARSVGLLSVELDAVAALAAVREAAHA